jgi:hypothetical protein
MKHTIIWRKNSRWKIWVKPNFVYVYKLNIFRRVFLYTNLHMSRKYCRNSIWIKRTPKGLLWSFALWKKYPFRPKQEGEVVLGAEYPYLSAIGALMYLANNTRPDIAFAVNYLARHSTTPTMRHWNDINNILRYLNGIMDLDLFFRRNQESDLIGYADAGYLSDPQNDRS